MEVVILSIVIAFGIFAALFRKARRSQNVDSPASPSSGQAKDSDVLLI